MQINLHQTHHEIGDYEGLFKYLTNSALSQKKAGLHLFPELFLTGYPLQDLVLKKTFYEDYLHFLADIEDWSLSQKSNNANETHLLYGGLHYEFDHQNRPLKITNVIYHLNLGKRPLVVYTKQLLPNYDIYEEKKYFTAGTESKIIEIDGKNIALLICEDMWFSHLHPHDPIVELRNLNEFIDVIINFSASPFHLDKDERRINRAKEISQYLKAPFIYVNRVGAEDDILFDGASFIVNGDTLIKKAKSFSSDYLFFELMEYRESNPTHQLKLSSNSWDELFSHDIDFKNQCLFSLSEKKCELLIDALSFGIFDYAQKNNCHKFLIALSGGIDSSLVLVILKLMQEKYREINHKKIEIEAVFMPGLFSSSLSYDLSYDLCQNLKIKLFVMPIKFIHSTIKTHYRDAFNTEMKGLADENIQSRLRGNLIYARSNDQGQLVLNTSNKSELAVGYSTLYGDSVGALSVLGDVYKTHVFQLANYINKKYPRLIPEEIITRPPSAELRENQVDQESLPPYDALDVILEAFLSMCFTPNDLIQQGLNKDDVLKVFQLIAKSEYKRRQFCPIIKVRPKSFGLGNRMPISKRPF